MNRLLIGTLASALAFASLAPVAQAAPKKGKAKAAAAAKAHQEAPQSAEISKSMGDLKWGTTREEVLQQAMDKVREKYKPLLAKATGAIEEDKVRAKMRDELSHIRSSLVEFNGEKTGWDVSFLKGEFTHHNGESMFVVNDETSQNYYFFIKGRLWKWYKAFNSSVFQGKSFDEFAAAVNGRYGTGVEREGELIKGAGKQRWLEWQDADTRLRAVDNNQFYGFYCLVFEHKDTLNRLAELRTVAPETKKSSHALVEAVTMPDGPEEGDQNKDIIDRITGNMRVRQQAEPAGKGNKAAPPKPQKAASVDEPSVAAEDDPLRGL